MNDKDSGLPVAILLYTLHNTSTKPLTVNVMGNVTNIVGPTEGRVNRTKTGGGLRGLVLSNEALAEDAPGYGTIALSTPADGAWVWPRGTTPDPEVLEAVAGW